MLAEKRRDSLGEMSDRTRDRIFSFFDEDGSGVIEEAEMVDKLRMLGFDGAEALQLFADLPGSRSSGSVSREQLDRYCNEDAAMA